MFKEKELKEVTFPCKRKPFSKERKQEISDRRLGRNSLYPNGTRSYLSKQAKKIWKEKHGKIEINGEEYLLKGMHILIGTRKMPIHHKDFNYKNNVAWNLGLQQTIKNHEKIHIQYNRYLRFKEKLEKGIISFKEAKKYLVD